MGVYENAKLETRKKIICSFWELYKITSIEKITVKDITDASGIYRTTFYLHFSDIYAILEKIEAHFLQELYEIEEIEGETENDSYMERMSEMLRRNCDYLQILVNEQKNPEFAKKYKSEIVNRICRHYQINLQELNERSRIVIERTLSAVIDLFFEWADTQLFSFEELSGIVHGYMQNGILHTINTGAEKSEQ